MPSFSNGTDRIIAGQEKQFTEFFCPPTAQYFYD